MSKINNTSRETPNLCNLTFLVDDGTAGFSSSGHSCYKTRKYVINKDLIQSPGWGVIAVEEQERRADAFTL